MQRLLCVALIALLASSALALNKKKIYRDNDVDTVHLKTNRPVDVYDYDEVANGVSAECRRPFFLAFFGGVTSSFPWNCVLTSLNVFIL